MTPDEMNKLRELAEKAQQDGLRIERRELDCGYFTYVIYGDSNDFASTCEIANMKHAKQNAEYIIAANPTTILSLLDRIELLEKKNNEMLDALLDIANGPRDLEVERARQALKDCEEL